MSRSSGPDRLRRYLTSALLVPPAGAPEAPVIVPGSPHRSPRGRPPGPPAPGLCLCYVSTPSGLNTGATVSFCRDTEYFLLGERESILERTSKSLLQTSGHRVFFSSKKTKATAVGEPRFSGEVNDPRQAGRARVSGPCFAALSRSVPRVTEPRGTAACVCCVAPARSGCWQLETSDLCADSPLPRGRARVRACDPAWCTRSVFFRHAP